MQGEAGIAIAAVAPFGDTRLGLYIFVGASILKDAVNRIGDLIDHGEENSSFKG